MSQEWHLSAVGLKAKCTRERWITSLLVVPKDPFGGFSDVARTPKRIQCGRNPGEDSPLSRGERKKGIPPHRCRFFFFLELRRLLSRDAHSDTHATYLHARFDEKFLIRDPKCRTRITRVINATRYERGRTGMHISHPMHSLVRSITAREMKTNNVSEDINIDGYRSIALSNCPLEKFYFRDRCDFDRKMFR